MRSQGILSSSPFPSGDLPRGLLADPPGWVQEEAPHLQAMINLCSDPSSDTSGGQVLARNTLPGCTNSVEGCLEGDVTGASPGTRRDAAMMLAQLLNRLIGLEASTKRFNDEL